MSSGSDLDREQKTNTFYQMKKPTVIITDPKKVAEICSKQPTVSREQAIRSILVQNGNSSATPRVKAS